jgi:ABC-type antimicrobial peptide transport system permease subunit
VTFRDTLGLALRNLGEAKLRTSLTTMGVSIGIASLAGMVSLGVGLQDQFVGRFTKSGVFDAITVTPGQDRPGLAGSLGAGRGGGRNGFGARRRAQRSGQAAADTPAMRSDLNDDTIKELAALDRVRDVFPNIQVPVEAKYGDESEPTLAGGVPMSARGEGPFAAVAYGSFFSGDSAAECLLSLPLAKRIDDVNPQSLLGKQLTLGHAGYPAGPPLTSGAAVPAAPARADTPFTIVGIVERETGPLGGTIAVSGVMIPLGRAKEILAASRAAAQAMGASRPAERLYTSIIVKVTHAQYTQDVQDRIRERGFSAFSLNDALQGAKRAFMVLDIVLSLIGSIALAVSSLGIMNTMVMSILERTREIGIMKAIGGSDGDIRRIFLIEASAIGFFGGVVGVALGWGVGRLINFGANVYIQNQGGTPGNLFSLPLWLIGGAIGFSIAISLIAGSYPAARAARLDPIQALRHD